MSRRPKFHPLCLLLAQKCANQDDTGKAAELAAGIAKSSTRYVETVEAISKPKPPIPLY